MTHTPYHYEQHKTRNWPKIILITLGILILAFIIVFFIIDPLNVISKKANNLINETSGGALSDNTYDCSSDVYNCGNFTTRAEAQAVFDACGPEDVHGLDADGNGEACESLPR